MASEMNEDAETTDMTTGDEPAGGPLLVSLGSLFKALARTAADKGPVLGHVVRALRELQAAHQAERLGLWLEDLNANDPDFGENIDHALAGPERDLVRSVVLEGARAATEAIHPIVVPSLGRLTNRYLTTRTPELRLFRDLLSMLRTLEADEYRGLCKAIRDLRKNAPLEESVRTRLTQDGDGGWQWQATLLPPATGQPERHVLLKGEVARRVVTALTSARAAFLGALDEPQPHTPHVSRELTKLLSSILDDIDR